jgi:hypothetical protein
MCQKEIGLCAHNIDTSLALTVNTMGRAYVMNVHQESVNLEYLALHSLNFKALQNVLHFLNALQAELSKTVWIWSGEMNNPYSLSQT